MFNLPCHMGFNPCRIHRLALTSSVIDIDDQNERLNRHNILFEFLINEVTDLRSRIEQNGWLQTNEVSDFPKTIAIMCTDFGKVNACQSVLSVFTLLIVKVSNEETKFEKIIVCVERTVLPDKLNMWLVWVLHTFW